MGSSDLTEDAPFLTSDVLILFALFIVPGHRRECSSRVWGPRRVVAAPAKGAALHGSEGFLSQAGDLRRCDVGLLGRISMTVFSIDKIFTTADCVSEAERFQIGYFSTSFLKFWTLRKERIMQRPLQDIHILLLN